MSSLHYYDAIGLVSPSAHSGAGYRLMHARILSACTPVRMVQLLARAGFAAEEDLGLFELNARYFAWRRRKPPQIV